MKKNRMMRLASMLLVAVLVTTTTISGTYAKYVTTAGAQDAARVAKFGVEVKAAGTLFAETYNDDNAIVKTDDGISVKSEGAIGGISNLVAPGTKKDDGITFSIKGQPEVDVKVSVTFLSLDDADNDVFLNGTDFPNTTTGNDEDDKFDATDYYPVKYTLKKGGVAIPSATDVNLATLRSELGKELNKYFEAGTNLTTELGEYSISWAWNFTETPSVIGSDDICDTLLGDLAAGKTEAVDESGTKGTNYNLATGISFDIRVEQID